VVEFSHYHHDPSTKRNKDYQRNDLSGTIGTMKEHGLGSNSNEYRRHSKLKETFEKRKKPYLRVHRNHI